MVEVDSSHIGLGPVCHILQTHLRLVHQRRTASPIHSSVQTLVIVQFRLLGLELLQIQQKHRGNHYSSSWYRQFYSIQYAYLISFI